MLTQCHHYLFIDDGFFNQCVIVLGEDKYTIFTELVNT